MVETKKKSVSKRDDPYRVQVLDRSLAILNALASKHDDLSLADIAAMVHLHKSTVHRIVMTLERERIVEKHPETGHYRLGLRLFELGSIAVARFDIRDRGRIHLEKLVYDTEETGHLCVMDQGEVLYLDKLEPARSVRLSSSIGRRNPAHCTGVGKAIMAWMPEREVDAIIRKHGLPRFTPKTLVTPAELKSDLKICRQRGYAIDDEEHEEGVRCVAAPVMDHFGYPIAALSVSAPSFRITLAKVPMLAEFVCKASATLSREFGYAPREMSLGLAKAAR
ncbi:MAG TPA: IclR family transcriptional regulator [Terriglobales bacterium]|nr:IclR family transcriptional regulator [Terriglobales bacterium]